MGNDNRRNAEAVVRLLKQSGHEAYFVGGCVRDFILGSVSGDYDIVTSARPNEIISLFPNTLAIGAKFGVVAIIVDNYLYEVATFRGDDVYADGRHPSRIYFSSAREDVFRRDFTINGLLMDPESNKIIDYVDGRADIEKKIIRTIGDPEKRFNEDFLRMLRAIRFAANLNFTIEPLTMRAIKNNATKIKQISAERIRDELGKILTRGGSRRGFELMAETGILKAILPEVDKMKGVEQPLRFHPEGDVWQHTLSMLELLSKNGGTSENLCLAWSVLLHDVGKVVTRTEDENGVHFYGHVQQGEKIADDIMERLKFSNAQKETVLNLIHHHMVFMNVQKMRPARLKRFLRMPDFGLHLELHRLDCLASHGMLDNYEFCQDRLRSLNRDDLHPKRLLTGDDLIEMGFTPGKIIGMILLALEEEQLEGRIMTTKEARDYVRNKWMKE
ncbi:MAG: hypothetical protein APR62_02365 [Smithella sp. SDB]|nr:MAG: hypothetical protein APR62_02365 [Smithella sp. SDB]